jgi:hypothetical protein
MKRITPLKLTCVGAFVAALGVGCASSGYARYDADSTDKDVGVAASADIGTDRDVKVTSTTNMDRDASTGAYAQMDTGTDRATILVDEKAEGEARVTVSALSFNPETRANWVNKFPFYDQNWNLRVIETYTFAAPDANLQVATRSNLPEFSASLPPGSVYVEAAGGPGEVRTGRVIQHSPNPR